MKIYHQPSPNFDSRNGEVVDMLVLHYTGMPTGQEALFRLCDPSAKVSAHYMVEEDGRIYKLIEESERAWHAGVSSWRGHTNINARSIGIEIANPGHEFGYRLFPEEQMKAVIVLCQDILSRHPIPARNVVGHSDVAPERKEDPGELFDWKRLAEEGIGLWPEINPEKIDHWLSHDENILSLQAELENFGYHLEPTGIIDSKMQKVMIAFQRHFRPKKITGICDAQCSMILESLIEMIKR